MANSLARKGVGLPGVSESGETLGDEIPCPVKGRFFAPDGKNFRIKKCWPLSYESVREVKDNRLKSSAVLGFRNPLFKVL